MNFTDKNKTKKDYGTLALEKILNSIKNMSIEEYEKLYNSTKPLHSKKAMENAANRTHFNLGKENNWIKTYLIIAFTNGLFFGILVGAALYKVLFL